MKSRLSLLPPMLAALLVVSATASAQQTFPSQEAASKALLTALGMTRADADRLSRVFGPNWQAYVPDDNIGRGDVNAFIARYKE